VWTSASPSLQIEGEIATLRSELSTHVETHHALSQTVLSMDGAVETQISQAESNAKKFMQEIASLQTIVRHMQTGCEHESVGACLGISDHNNASGSRSVSSIARSSISENQRSAQSLVTEEREERSLMVCKAELVSFSQELRAEVVEQQMFAETKLEKFA
jgi:hypothetical protein